MNELPDAAEMRRRLNTAQSVTAQQQIKELTEKITAAVNRGMASITVSSFAVGVEDALKAKGYKVTYYPADQRDPRDAAYYTVSW